MSPTHSCITGKESADPGSPIAALADFYRAFNGRDLDGVRANWAEGAPIAMDNPLGGILRGWAEIGGVYERLFSGPAKVYVEFYDFSLHETDEMFYVVGRERGRFERDRQQVDLRIRTSRLYQKLDGRWRQVHHHGSIDEPDLLKTYQQAVHGRAT